MPRNTSDTPRSRALGAELRKLREDAGYKLRQFAGQVGISYVALSRWETGARPPSPEDVATLLVSLGVRGAERDRLLQMARDAGDPNWVTPGVDKLLTALMDFERTASRIVDVAPLLIPGLLQTADYARPIIAGGGAGRGEVEQRVTLRMGRRDVLTRDNPVHLLALIGEDALRRPIGGPSVMAAQLRHIEKIAALPNVTVQAVPRGPEWTPALSGPFIVLEFPLASPIVHFEHLRSSMFLPDKKDVEDMRKAAETIRETAMSPEATSGLITEIRNEMEHAT